VLFESVHDCSSMQVVWRCHDEYRDAPHKKGFCQRARR
jgi:hypothetical protein